MPRVLVHSSQKLADRRNRDLRLACKRLRTIAVGGSPCDQRVLRACERRAGSTDQSALDQAWADVVSACNVPLVESSISVTFSGGCPSSLQKSWLGQTDEQLTCLLNQLEELRLDCAQAASCAVVRGPSTVF